MLIFPFTAYQINLALLYSAGFKLSHFPGNGSRGALGPLPAWGKKQLRYLCPVISADRRTQAADTWIDSSTLPSTVAADPSPGQELSMAGNLCRQEHSGCWHMEILINIWLTCSMGLVTPVYVNTRWHNDQKSTLYQQHCIAMQCTIRKYRVDQMEYFSLSLKPYPS